MPNSEKWRNSAVSDVLVRVSNCTPRQFGIFHHIIGKSRDFPMEPPARSALTHCRSMALDRITLGHFRNHAASRLDGSRASQPARRRERRGQDQRARGAVAARARPRAAPRAAGRDGGERRPRHVRGQRGARLRRRPRAGHARHRHQPERPRRRIVQVNGAETSAVALGEWLAVGWLTPAMDGAVRRQRGRAAALHGPTGAGARSGARAPCLALRGGAARAQPPAGGRGRARPAMARFDRGAAGRGRRRAGGGARACWSNSCRPSSRRCPRRRSRRPRSALLGRPARRRRTGADLARHRTRDRAAAAHAHRARTATTSRSRWPARACPRRAARPASRRRC